jgi:hypothetical protein
MVGFGTSPIELMSADAMLRGEIYCESFSYIFQTTDLAASETESLQIQVDSASDFVYQEINLVALTAVNTYDNDPDLLVALIVAGSGRNLMQRAQHVSTFCGTYRDAGLGVGLPGRQPFPRLIQANNTLEMTLQERGGIAFNGAGAFIQFALMGYKVFYTGGSRREIFHIQ